MSIILIITTKFVNTAVWKNMVFESNFLDKIKQLNICQNILFQYKFKYVNLSH